jgi:predicted transcriptional regulator
VKKPKGMVWLEQQTGETLDVSGLQPIENKDRHLSVRLTDELGSAVDALARERRATPSQLVRELLEEAITARRTAAALDAHALVHRLEADVAEVRRRLAG